MSENHDKEIGLLRPWRQIQRRKSRQIMVGNVPVGGDAPISVQSMTNTLTSDAQATIAQINDITEAGADIVRVSCPDPESSLALREITKAVDVPIVADIHFHYKRGIEAAENGAACLRINPGNIGGKERVREVVSGAGQWLLHPYRCQRRIFGKRAIGKIRRAVPRSYGGERVNARPYVTRRRFPRI